MSETSRFWGGTTTGDAAEAPYDAEIEFASVIRSLSTAAQVANLGGVFRNELNELEVAAGAGQVSVETGRGIADGTWYQNDAAVNVAIPTPAGATRIDRIVLRKDFTAKTVRITRIAGAEGGGAPALVQTPGTTWDVPLAQVSITTGGVITVTDQRTLLPYLGAIGSASTPVASDYGGAGAIGADNGTLAQALHQHPMDAESRGVYAASVNGGPVTTTSDLIDDALTLPSGLCIILGTIIVDITGGTEALVGLDISGTGNVYLSGHDPSDPTLTKTVLFSGTGTDTFAEGPIHIFGYLTGAGSIQLRIGPAGSTSAAATGGWTAIKE